jgi:hypothetical protein
MSTAATPVKKLKMEYVVSEPKSSNELRQHLKEHAEQGYEVVQILPQGAGFLVVFGRPDIFSAGR